MTRKYPTTVAIGLLILGLVANAAYGQERKKKAADAPAAGSPGGSGAQEVNVEAIKEKYWARGEESEMGVVQNRLYSKEHKFELSLFGGFLTSDPFLSINSLGGSLGYHFNEYISLHTTYWHAFVGKSAALNGFQEVVKASSGAPAVPDGNYPENYYAAEVLASLLYGKLSLVGKAIIYYDLHLIGGLGATDTEYAMLFTPSFGVGQQFYLNKVATLNLDYRITYYREHLLKKADPSDTAPPPDVGRVSSEARNNWTHAITLGVSFFFGF